MKSGDGGLWLLLLLLPDDFNVLVVEADEDEVMELSADFEDLSFFLRRKENRKPLVNREKNPDFGLFSFTLNFEFIK